MKRERTLEELGTDPGGVDWALLGRRAHPTTRRGFMRDGGLTALAALVGARVPFASAIPSGWVPAMLQTDPRTVLPGKDPGLVLLNDRPLNAETPAHLLDDDVTPASRLFVRNNGEPPSGVDASSWTLTLDGESVEREVSIRLSELKQRLEAHTLQLQLECAGNGRSEFRPPARGNQWTTGAIGCPSFTGARLRDVLALAGVKRDAVYVAYYGADTRTSGDVSKPPISRGVPVSKAMQNETLLAWAMNGEDLPALHGSPLRLVCGGWPASTSAKWVERIVVRDRVHDGPKMEAPSYRVPCTPVAPEEDVPADEMCIIELMPVKSIITRPRSGIDHEAGRPLFVRGHAWAGEQAVDSVHVSIDFGQTWRPAKLRQPANRLAWQHWEARLSFPSVGYYEIWARATDVSGRAQPMLLPGWNPRGYLNNACHRIAVRVLSNA